MPKTTENILKEWKKWKHLEEITIAWALELINRKTDKEISDIINLSKAEIKVMVNNFNIKKNETLVSQIQGGTKLTEREEEFFTLIKQGKNISEISKTLMVSRARVKTVVKIIIAKILIGLYDYYNAKFSYVSEFAHPVLEGMRYYGFLYDRAAGRIGDYWYEFDENGKVHLKIKCDSFERIDENHIIISIDKKYGLIDNYGNYLITPEYEALKATFGNGLPYFTAKLNGKYGVIDEKGKTVIDFKYDGTWFFGDKEHICAKLNNKWGLIDIDENIIIPFIYDECFNICIPPFETKDGFIVIKNDKYGVINLENKVVIPFEYAYVEIFSDETIFAHDSFGTGHIIDFSNKKLCDREFQFISTEENSKYFCAMAGDRHGLIDKYGNIKIDFKYDNLFFLNENFLVANKDGDEGIIDIDDNVIIPFEYGCFNRDKCLDKDGTIPAVKIVKNKIKEGLINLQNEVLIDFRFDTLMPFWDRKYTLAITDNKWVYVNKKGEILKIDIENYVTK